MILLDTSALLFWTLGTEPLPQSARRVVEHADAIIVSSISIWEIALKVKKGRLDLSISVQEFLARLRRLNSVQITPVTDTIWLESVELAWEHQDPADRVIVATARLNRCPLVTSDGEIRKFYAQAVW